MTNFPLDFANDYVLTGDDMPGGFCSTVELCVGILAACIADEIWTFYETY